MHDKGRGYGQGSNHQLSSDRSKVCSGLDLSIHTELLDLYRFYPLSVNTLLENRYLGIAREFLWYFYKCRFRFVILTGMLFRIFIPLKETYIVISTINVILNDIIALHSLICKAVFLLQSSLTVVLPRYEKYCSILSFFSTLAYFTIAIYIIWKWIICKLWLKTNT